MSQNETNGSNGHGVIEPAAEQAIENVIIIGSGPSGLTAGLYTARANLNPLLITGNEIGGQVAITYEVENYPGFPESLSGPDLVEKMQKQAEKFGCRIEYDYVDRVDFEQFPFTVHTANEMEYKAKAIIISTGASSRKLDVPGEKELTGRGVSYCATCDGFFFRGREVVVVGGGDSAAEEALFLTRFASKVTLIHRRNSLRASQILQKRIFEHEKINVIWDTVITSINDDRIEAVVAQVLGQPGSATFLHDLGALLDAPSVENHDRDGEAAVLGAPPARRPVRATLFLESAITEECHQAFSRQRRVHILQPGEPQIAAFGDRAGRVRPGMATQRYRGPTLLIDGIGVEVRDQTRQARLAAVVASTLGGGYIACQCVHRFDRGHAVPLPHEPAACRPGQRVGQQITHEGWHHVERAAGVAFGRLFEIIGAQWAAASVDAPGIGHMRHYAHGRAGHPVGCSQQRMGRGFVCYTPLRDQTLH